MAVSVFLLLNTFLQTAPKFVFVLSNFQLLSHELCCVNIHLVAFKVTRHPLHKAFGFVWSIRLSICRFNTIFVLFLSHFALLKLCSFIIYVFIFALTWREIVIVVCVQFFIQKHLNVLLFPSELFWRLFVLTLFSYEIFIDPVATALFIPSLSRIEFSRSDQVPIRTKDCLTGQPISRIVVIFIIVASPWISRQGTVHFVCQHGAWIDCLIIQLLWVKGVNAQVSEAILMIDLRLIRVIILTVLVLTRVLTLLMKHLLLIKVEIILLVVFAPFKFSVFILIFGMLLRHVRVVNYLSISKVEWFVIALNLVLFGVRLSVNLVFIAFLTFIKSWKIVTIYYICIDLPIVKMLLSKSALMLESLKLLLNVLVFRIDSSLFLWWVCLLRPIHGFTEWFLFLFYEEFLGLTPLYLRRVRFVGKILLIVVVEAIFGVSFLSTYVVLIPAHI